MAMRTGQSYRYGWLTAFGGLANVVSPAFVAGLAGWSLAVGVAAAAVRPWSWYVLLVSQLVGLIWGALYMAFVALTWADRVMVVVFSLAMSGINFAYFYKRRALFRANGPGFTGLPPLYRVLFAAAVVMAPVATLLPSG